MKGYPFGMCTTRGRGKTEHRCIKSEWPCMHLQLTLFNSNADDFDSVHICTSQRHQPDQGHSKSSAMPRNLEMTIASLKTPRCYNVNGSARLTSKSLNESAESLPWKSVIVEEHVQTDAAYVSKRAVNAVQSTVVVTRVHVRTV